MPKTGANEFVRSSEVVKGKLKEVTFSLMMLREGEVAIVAEIRGGHGACRRLNELGLIPGVRVKMVNKISRGPVIIKVKGSKLALGRGLASKIRVTPE